MSQDFRNGRVVINFLYTATGACLILGGIFVRNLSLPVRLIVIISQLLAGGYMLLNGKEQEKSQGFYCRFQVVASLLQGYWLCLVFGNGNIFLYIMLQSLAVLTYLDYKLCFFQLVVTIIFIVLAKVFSLPGLNEHLTINGAVFGLANLSVMEWLAMNIAKNYAFRERENIEKEQSLDDMLKVIEVKCDEAMQATRSKSDFLSNMSHEIRTPINAILGMNEMILRESRDEEIIDYAANVEQSGKMLLALINEILDLSKIESGKMEIVPVEYKMSSILNDALNMVRERAEKKGLILKVEADPEIPDSLYGDEIRIRQVLTNLLTNGVKYTNEGTVTLVVDFEELEKNQIMLNIQVKDTGIGIKEEDQKSLFVAFQRLDQVNNRHIEGTGLGLPITGRLVEMMQGTICVDSVYGEGSCFSVSIPQKVISYEPMGDFKKKFQDSTRKRKGYHRSFVASEAKILVVDDNKMNLKVAKALLKETLVQVTLCESGQECLNLLKEQTFDVILLDHMMPVMDGMETLKHIREMENPDCSRIPVIALTANAISGVRSMYLEAGFDAYLSKPIVGGALEAILCKYIPREKIRFVEEEDTENASQAEETGVTGGLEAHDEAEATKQEAMKQETTKPEALAEEAAPAAEMAEKDGDVPILNVANGLVYSGDSQEIYAEFLTMFRDMREEKETALKEAYEGKDMGQYAILIHAVKSNAFSIGGDALGEMAKKLENAAKEEDWTFVEEYHENALDLYEKTANGADEWLKNYNNQTS